jgi:hypothetical protein
LIGAPLVADSSDNLYGEASYGGPSNSGGPFKLSNPDTNHTPLAETDLADFSAGSSAIGGLTLIRKKLFGASQNGGGSGYTFEFDFTTDALTTTGSFPNVSGGGENPSSGLIFDAKGNAYG